eukprot:5334627-Prymnesium_polylepis.1
MRVGVGDSRLLVASGKLAVLYGCCLRAITTCCFIRRQGWQSSVSRAGRGSSDGAGGSSACECSAE